MVFRSVVALKGIVVTFDPSGGLVATVNTNDGRVKVFSAVTGELHVDLSKAARSNGEAAARLTCACWSQAEAKQLCVGRSDGAVICLDASRANKAWSAEAGIPGAVQSCCSDTQDRLIATGAQGEVVCLDPADGAVKWRCTVTGQDLACSGAAAKADRLLVASSYLFVLQKQQVALKLSGHTAPVTCMAVSEDGEVLASGARGERSIALFSCRIKGGGGGDARVPTRKARLSLSLPEPAASVACCACHAHSTKRNGDAGTHGDGEDGAAYMVAAVAEGGAARVWRCSKEGKEWRGRLRRSIRVDSADQCILAMAFQGPDVLLVAHGVPVAPSIQQVSLVAGAADGESEEGAELVLASAGPLLAPAALPRTEAPQRPAATGIGADNAGLPVATASQSRKRGADAATGGGGGTTAAAGPATDGAEAAEPLGERLARLFPELPAAAASAAAVGPDGGRSTREPITADSLTVLLTQAIKAGDKELLEKVLSSGRGVSITRTVQRLPAASAVAFFQQLVTRLQRTPARAAALLPWLRAALLHHAAALSASPPAQAAVAQLGGIVRQRAEALQPMLALRGRLEVLLATATVRDDAADAAFEPKVHVAASSLKPQSLKSAIHGVESDDDAGDDASGEEYEVEDPYNPEAGASSDDGGSEEASGSDEEEELSEDEEAGSESGDEEDEMDVDG
eukprot:jgi/Ulvmu1/2300/UM013_0147.1